MTWHDDPRDDRADADEVSAALADLLEHPVPGEHAERLAAIAGRVLEASAPRAARHRRSWRHVRRASLAVLAVAAALVLWWGTRRAPSPPSPPPLRAESTISMQLVVEGGQITVAGRPLAAGTKQTVATVATASLETGDAAGCVRVDDDARVCLDAHSRAHVDGHQPPTVRVERGTVVTALEGGPASARWRLDASSTELEAEIAVIAVEIAGDHVTTTVLEGSVEVLRRDDVDGPLTAGQSLRIDARAARVDSSPARARERYRRLLGTHVDHGAPPSTLAPVAPEAEPMPPSAPPRADGGPSVESLLAEARAHVAAQRWEAAARAYQRLIGGHPTRRASRTGLVRLGDIQLRHLGKPRAALRSFERYLTRGGALAQEARLGRIRALAALGHHRKEARAIERFLAEHGTSPHAERLRRRREALGR